MNISYDYYRIFYYVARHGSITEAANALLNNQPNITRAIKNLEAELGCTLFIRSNRGVTLTPEGEELYSHIALAFEHIRAGEDEICAGRGLQSGVVTIGATEIALRCFLLPILNNYRSRYPGIKIKISNMSTPQAIASLKSGLSDLAVVTRPTVGCAELSEMRVMTFSDAAICGDGLKQKLDGGAYTFEELSRFPIVFLGKGHSGNSFYSELFAKHGIAFSADIEVATADQIIHIVRHNLGIGFVPEKFLDDEPNGICKLELRDKIPSREICLVTRKGRAPSLPARELEKMIAEAARL